MLFELLHYAFFQNALLSTLLISICCGLVGTYIVARRMVFISGGITHASFGGLGISYYLGMPPMVGATLFAIFTSLLIERLSSKGKIREDALIGMLWSTGMAIGILFIYLTPGYAPDLMSYLFGNILTITTGQLYYAVILTVLVLLFFLFFYRPLFYIAFDAAYSQTRNLPVHAVNATVMVLVALTIVVCMKLAGIILVISYLTMPQIIVSQFTSSFKKQLIGSTGVSCFGSFIGLYLAAIFDLPSGATIVVCFLCLFILTKFVQFIIKLL